jgi:predicted transcriptional regulator
MARKKMAIPRKPCGFRLDVELVKQLKILAIEKNLPVNLLLEEAIQGLLTRHATNERQEE